MTSTSAQPTDVERLDPFTLWCGCCGRKLVRVLASFMCVCGRFDPALLTELPIPKPESLWRHSRQGWIAEVEVVKFDDAGPTEIVAAYSDPSLLGRKLLCSLAFLRDRCHPYDPGGGR